MNGKLFGKLAIKKVPTSHGMLSITHEQALLLGYGALCIQCIYCGASAYVAGSRKTFAPLVTKPHDPITSSAHEAVMIFFITQGNEANTFSIHRLVQENRP